MANGLNAKQQAFIDEYLICWNASDAARRAHYAKPGQQGHRLLKNVEIAAAIDQRLTALGMTANEVVSRLTEHARADMRDFVKVDEKGEPYGFDLSPDKPLHLIKKMTITTDTFTHDDGEIQTTKRVQFELHDSQAALDKLARIRGLFIERHEVNWHIDVLNWLRSGTVTPDEVKALMGYEGERLVSEFFASANRIPSAAAAGGEAGSGSEQEHAD